MASILIHGGKRPSTQRFLLIPSLVVPMLVMGCGSGYNSTTTTTPSMPAAPTGTTITSLNTIAQVSTTVDPTNHDANPYAIVMVPTSTTITVPSGATFKAGDLLVSNFSNSAGTNGAGTTIEDITPSASAPAPVTFSNAVSGPVALALNANLTALWVANFGASPDGTMGDVQVLNSKGTTFTYGNIKNQNLWGSWGQAFNGQAVGATPAPAFFDTNVLTGGVYRLQGFPPTPSSGPNFAAATITQIGSLGHSGTNANNVVGPQGMAYVSAGDTLYVVDAVNNRIVSFSGVSTATAVEQPTVVYSGMPLNQPAGLAINPINGDLLVVNQGDNNLIELALPSSSSSSMYSSGSTTATVVGTKTLDPTPVVNGSGSALFGLTATEDSNGHLMVYFTDDNTNTVDVLKM